MATASSSPWRTSSRSDVGRDDSASLVSVPSITVSIVDCKPPHERVQGSAGDHKLIRQRVCEYMLANRANFEPFVEDDEKFDDYMRVRCGILVSAVPCIAVSRTETSAYAGDDDRRQLGWAGMHAALHLLPLGTSCCCGSSIRCLHAEHSDPARRWSCRQRAWSSVSTSCCIRQGRSAGSCCLFHPVRTVWSPCTQHLPMWRLPGS